MGVGTATSQVARAQTMRRGGAKGRAAHLGVVQHPRVVAVGDVEEVREVLLGSRECLASPSELLASSSELLLSPSSLLVSPSELSASPSELLASPSELVASPSEL
jgi:hypothetical protein